MATRLLEFYRFNHEHKVTLVMHANNPTVKRKSGSLYFDLLCLAFSLPTCNFCHLNSFLSHE